jgi:hypothetical protein
MLWMTVFLPVVISLLAVGNYVHISKYTGYTQAMERLTSLF